MGINIEMTGSGELGPLAPGWSVQEYATPVTIGNTAGGTGGVSFTAAAREDSLFVVNNDITTTEETLGAISGVVKSVSQSGLNVNVTHNTQLAIFDATKDIPALGAGGVYPALDLCNQLSTRQILLTLPSGRFYSMGGHSAGFDTIGGLVEPEVNDGSYLKMNYDTAKQYPVYFREQYGSLWADTFTIINNEIYATHVYGDCFTNNRGIRTSRLAFKSLLDGDNLSWGFTASPDDSNTGSGQNISLVINATTGMLSLSGKYRSNGLLDAFNQQYNLSTTLDLSESIVIFIEYTRPINPGNYTITVKICNESDYNNIVTLTQVFAADLSSYNQPWEITGNVRAIYRDQGLDLGAWIQEYEAEETYVVQGAVTIDGPVPALANTNMWEYLQNACSAYDYEIALVNDMVVARAVGQTTINIDNKTTPTITPNMSFSGRSVEVVYTNAMSVANQELYNARDDNNRVISVKAEETITTTVPISGTPTVVNLPVMSTQPKSGVGEYKIVDSKGAPISQYLWALYGGRLDIQVSTTALNAIDITFVGPSSTDGTFNDTVVGGTTTPALYPGPYKLAYSSGSSDYAALSITGAGVKTTPTTLKVYTASDYAKVPQDVAKTISNPFIVTKNQAYDRGLWAVCEASGPNVTLSASIPVSSVQSFGLVAGSLIRYRDSIYRITDATIGNLAININAIRHVTVDDFDALWNGKTVASHDLMWSGYDTSDQVIAPLRYVGDDESVLMFLDTDVNPYYDFNGEPEISVFQDTDTNPYYEEGGNLEGEDIIKLDTDENPYDEDIQ